MNDYLVAILQWNNPLERVDNEFSLELDTLVNSIVLHIVQSGVREYGNTLIDGGQQWILDRFATRMVHTDLRARYNSMILLLALLRQQEEHRKVFIVQNYDIIKTVINLMKSERSQRLLRLEINLIAHSILRECKDYDSLNPQDAVALDPLNIEMAFLEQFMSYKGHEVLEDVKHQFRENESIFNIVTAF